MILTDLTSFFGTHWGAAVAVGSMFFGLTVLSVRMLDPSIRHTIALRLMGVERENWCKSFCALFDGCFGRNHLSLICIVRSSIASLFAVTILWLIFGAEAGLEGRATDTLPFLQLVLIAVGINLVADYVSLLETRWLLGKLQHWQGAMIQALALVVDALVTGAIILAAIFVFQISPLYDGAAISVGEIIGVFSVFGVLFYSTFLTSVWTWGYILSSWVIRLFTWAKLDKALDLEDSLPFVAGTVMALVVGTGTFAASVPLTRDEVRGTNLVEEGLCWAFGGDVCHRVAVLTADEALRAQRVLNGCATGAPAVCLAEGLVQQDIDPTEAARHWRAACDGGEVTSCSNLGFIHHYGQGVPQDLDVAADLYRQGCDGGAAVGCYNLGVLANTSSPPDLETARDRFAEACALDAQNLGCLEADWLTRHIELLTE